MSTEKAEAISTTQENVNQSADFIGIDYDKLEEAVKIFRALNNKQRQRIIQKIGEKKKINVTKLVDSLGMDQSAVSQQLAILRDAGIVSTYNNGRFVFYQVNNARLHLINNQIKHFLGR